MAVGNGFEPCGSTYTRECERTTYTRERERTVANTRSQGPIRGNERQGRSTGLTDNQAFDPFEKKIAATCSEIDTDTAAHGLATRAGGEVSEGRQRVDLAAMVYKQQVDMYIQKQHGMHPDDVAGFDEFTRENKVMLKDALNKQVRANTVAG